MPKFRNIIIFIAIAAIIFLVYLYFKPSSPQESLITTPTNSTLPDVNNSNTGVTSAANVTSGMAKDFLTLLLSVQSIKLSDIIFSDLAFENLKDSSIILTPDGNEGRPNPFAQFGNDGVSAPIVPPISGQAKP